MARADKALRSGVASLRSVCQRFTAQRQPAVLYSGREHIEDAHWRIVESEARLRELLDAQDSLIVRRDAKGRVLYANRAYCDAFAVSVAEIIDRRFRPHVIESEIVPADHAGRRRVAERVETSAGPRWIEWDEQRASGASGQIDIQCIGRDVTDERRLASDLRAARDAAEAANRAKSRFLASMSHEIRTPMAGILGMASVLELTEQSDEQKIYTRAIDQSARALLALLDEILDFSKIEAGKLRFASEPFSLPACVRSAVDLFQPRAAAKGILLKCAIASDLPDRVLGDSDRVRQIVLNLLSNAIKFTDAGSIELTLSCTPQAGAACYDIVVRDTGVGLSPDTIALLFVEFEQAASGKAHHPAGTGLGLAISKRLARAMGGDLVAEGAPGHGATFTARLRLGDALGSADCRCVEPARVAGEFELSTGDRAQTTPRILIVEDNAINALLARSVCQRIGATVEVVRSGNEAVEAVRRTLHTNAQSFEIVLMDVFMPGIDGFETTRRISALFETERPAARCPPIIAVTANAYREDRERCLAAGMSDYLAKPFDAQQLSAVLSKWLPRRAAPPTAVAGGR